MQARIMIRISSDSSAPSQKSSYPAPEDVIELPSALDMITTTQTVRIGVLDSGIDASHSAFAGKLNENYSKNFVTYEAESPLVDPLGHGTHVAGIITAVAENIELISLRILDSNNGGYSSFFECS